MDFRSTETPKIHKFGCSGGLPKYGKTKFHLAIQVGFRSIETPKIRKFDSQVTSEKWKKPSFVSLKLEQENSKDSIWWASEERKTKKPRFIRSGGLPKNGKPRNQNSIGWASEERNPKICLGGLLKNENPKIRSGGLLKNENPKIKIRSGGLLYGKTKIQSGGVGFRLSGKEEPRFILGVSGVF
ncbi:unnamed protein product [Rhizophagus irregularis]|nr:unnamed protein product [Rhizophagus irregularis]